MKRIQRAILSFKLEYRIKLLLHTRSRALEQIFASVLAQKTMEDQNLKEVLHRLCSSNNLLSISDLRAVLSRGMEELEGEGWINSEEKDAILNAYAS